MRLINADKLETHEQLEGLGNGMYDYVEVVYKDDIDAQPTVEAIPISYIQNQIERWERSKTESYHAICYRHLIEEWKMEEKKEEKADNE